MYIIDKLPMNDCLFELYSAFKEIEITARKNLEFLERYLLVYMKMGPKITGKWHKIA